MSNIVIDVTRLAGRAILGRIPTGVDRVGLAYIDHFRSRSVALVRVCGRWVILDNRQSQQLFDALLRPGRNFIWLALYLIATGYVRNWKKHNDSILFNVVHTGLEHPSYAREITKRNYKPLFFLHDLIPITHPEYCRPGAAAKHIVRLKTMLDTGCGIVINTLHTKGELETFARQHQLPIPACLCAHVAPAQLPKPSATPLLDTPYFVILGTIEARKNHLMLLNLWRELAQELGDAAPRLVIIGGRGWECEQALDMLDRCEQIKGFVIEKPRCDDAELATWLAHARALLFPSFAEGFGIPLIEALALGTPVIASNLPAFHEIGGDIPDYVHPLDALSWKRPIMEYAASDSGPHQAQTQRMQGYTAPTWEQHFTQVDAFLQTLGIA